MSASRLPRSIMGGPVELSEPRNPLSRSRIERISDRTVSAFGLVFGVQTLPNALGQLSAQRSPWGVLVLVLVFGGLTFTVLLAIFAQRLVKVTMGVLAVVYFAAIVTWPLLVDDPSAFVTDKPWVWFLCSVFTAFAAVAYPLWLAIAYTLFTPVAYGVVRALPAGGGAGAEIAGLDVVYAVILGGVILSIIAMIRQAASAVDLAQSQALAKYANAVRQHTTEVERVQVDAIVHDSVLTTLLSAAGARTPEQEVLAAHMAADAIGHLHTAEVADPDDESPVGLNQLSDRLVTAARAFSSPFDVNAHDQSARSLPANVAEVVYSSAMQAMVNSVQHAGGDDVRRSIAISNGDHGAVVSVVVADSGCGFDLDDIPAERLGLRVSICERLEKAGGRATVVSAPGEGTSVTIVWPAGEPGSVAEREGESTG